MKNNNLVSRLTLIQKNLELYEPTFPVCCSLSVKKLSEELGFKPVAGYVLTKNGPKPHSWAETLNNQIADLTLFQFEKDYGFGIPRIILLDKSVAKEKYGYLESEEMSRGLNNIFLVYDKPLIEYPDFDNYKL